MKFKNVCRVINGRAYKLDELLEKGKYPVLRVGNFFTNSEMLYSDLELESDKYCEDDDLLFAWSASFGPKIYRGPKSIYHYHIWKLQVDDSKADKYYLYYWLLNNVRRMQAGGHGSVMAHITKQDMENQEIDLPPLQLQKRIAGILKSLDEKMDNNAQINKNLLDQVIALSKHIQESSSNMGVLSEIAQYSRNKVPVSSLDHNNYYSTENILANKGGSTRAEKLPSTELTIAVEPGDTLVSNIRPYFKKLVFVNRSGGCSNDVLCLHPLKPELQYYLYSVIYDDRFFDFMTKGSKGTKMPRGDKAQIMSYPLCLLSKEGLERFNGLVTPIFQEIKQLDYESRLLTQLRDELLPRLLSGEIELQ